MSTYAGTRTVQQMYNDKANNEYWKLYPITSAPNIILNSSINLDDIYTYPTTEQSKLKLINTFLPVQEIVICSTESEVQTKEIEIKDFNFENGSYFVLKFLNTNTINNPKLKINDSEAMDLLFHGLNINKNLLIAGELYYILYTGSAYEVLTDITNTFDGGDSTVFYSKISGGYSQWGSQWDDPIIWSKIEYTESPKGRKFARHPSNKGTVMSMNDGTDRNVLVLDSIYRTCIKKFYANSSATGLDLELTRCTHKGYFMGEAVELPFSGLSDSEMKTSQYISYCNQDENNSNFNTTQLISKGTGVEAEAANYCRTISISHNNISVNCDMANINVILRIFAEMSKLDSMDSTKTDDNSLTTWKFGSNSTSYNGCVSSSWYGLYSDSYYALGMNNDGELSLKTLNGYPIGTIPILEI